ncbi:hypothetical protein B0J11DRAFT_521092 [Dendryphion nanum]|uniref:Uncharacterized protein n=1 Tax=Dendryphion nanum TaxID=256645 RepID=A0A9P9IVE4_9PLEO|nr:hypothetical protein B0J11DRAFT_521092 [Dendryphion nanum]
MRANPATRPNPATFPALMVAAAPVNCEGRAVEVEVPLVLTVLEATVVEARGVVAEPDAEPDAEPEAEPEAVEALVVTVTVTVPLVEAREELELILGVTSGVDKLTLGVERRRVDVTPRAEESADERAEAAEDTADILSCCKVLFDVVKGVQGSNRWK